VIDCKTLAWSTDNQALADHEVTALTSHLVPTADRAQVISVMLAS